MIAENLKDLIHWKENWNATWHSSVRVQPADLTDTLTLPLLDYCGYLDLKYAKILN